jgi:hypothetical protein
VVLWLGDAGNRMLAIGVPAVLIALLSLRDLVAALRPVRRAAAAPAVDDAVALQPATTAGDVEVTLDLDLIDLPDAAQDREAVTASSARWP